MEGNITITKKHYLMLMMESEKLNRLECGGVDNWTWYDETMNSLRAAIPEGSSRLGS